MERSSHHHHQYVGGQGKVQGRSTSSISELFGDRDSLSATSASRSGVFQSVFSTPSSSTSQWSSVKGGGSSHFESSCRSKYGSSVQNQKFEHLDEVEPFFLSSSLYYGGQDMCVRPPTSHNSGTSNIFPKNGGEDDPNSNNSNSASRGNWWQGSLYY